MTIGVYVEENNIISCIISCSCFSMYLLNKSGQIKRHLRIKMKISLLIGIFNSSGVISHNERNHSEQSSSLASINQ